MARPWPKPFSEMSFEEKMNHVEVEWEDTLVGVVEEALERIPFSVIGSVSGRLSSSKPNAQYFTPSSTPPPRRSDQMFFADYASLERRLLRQAMEEK